MSHFRRNYLAGGTYFFTVVTKNRAPILIEPQVRALLREALTRVRSARPLTIDAWILLPDHIHAIWTLPDGDADFSTRWQEIKRFVSRELGQPIWQPRFWEHTVRDDMDFQNHMDYLHYNPVKHGLCEAVNQWPYSTFHRHVHLGNYLMDWGTELNLMAIPHDE